MTSNIRYKCRQNRSVQLFYISTHLFLRDSSEQDENRFHQIPVWIGVRHPRVVGSKSASYFWSPLFFVRSFHLKTPSLPLDARTLLDLSQAIRGEPKREIQPVEPSSFSIATGQEAVQSHKNVYIFSNYMNSQNEIF